MGIECFNCDHCKYVTNDHCDNVTFHIDEWGDYTVCPNCIPRVKSMLRLAEPLPYYCFCQHLKSGARHVFESYGELVQWLKLKDKSEEDYKFGYRRSTHWHERQVAAFIGQGSCGGMSEKEIILELDIMFVTHADKVETNWSNITVYAGWRGHACVKIVPSAKSTEEVVLAMAAHATKFKLQQRPVLIAAFDNLLPTHFSVLKYFSIPDDDESLVWASLDGVKSQLENPETANSEDDTIRWLATAEFVQHHKVAVAKRLLKGKRQLESLIELEMSISKKSKTKSTVDSKDDSSFDDHDSSDFDSSGSDATLISIPSSGDEDSLVEVEPKEKVVGAPAYVTLQSLHLAVHESFAHADDLHLVGHKQCRAGSVCFDSEEDCSFRMHPDLVGLFPSARDLRFDRIFFRTDTSSCLIGKLTVHMRAVKTAPADEEDAKEFVFEVADWNARIYAAELDE
jgi:hypothetical protein